MNGFHKKKMMGNEKLVEPTKTFLVDVVSTFRIRYAVEARDEQDALDEVVMREHDTDFKEFSQEHLGYHICSSRELTEGELIEQFDKDNDYLNNWSTKQKLNCINKIDYKG